MSQVLNQVPAVSVRTFPTIPNGDSGLFPRQEESLDFWRISQSLIFTVSKSGGHGGGSF